MGYLRHLGRVGALAVALGAGTALATPAGVALAEPSTSSDSSSSSSTDTGDSSASSAATTADSDSASLSTTAGGDTPSPPDDGSQRSRAVSTAKADPASPKTVVRHSGGNTGRGSIDSTAGADTDHDTAGTETEAKEPDKPVDGGSDEPEASDGDEEHTDEAEAPEKPEQSSDDETESPTAQEDSEPPAPARKGRDATPATPTAVVETQSLASSLGSQAPTARSVQTAPASITEVSLSARSEPDPTAEISAEQTDPAVTEPNAETLIEEPTPALQAQPEAFISVLSTLLDAAIAPYLAPDNPASPVPSPAILAVLAFVRREIEVTYTDLSVSYGGVQMVQTGTASATSEGVGSIAIAYGAGSQATASGWWNVAVVTGEGSSATAIGGMFNYVSVDGDGSEGVVSGGVSNTVNVVGDGSEGVASGGVLNNVSVVGDGSFVSASGGVLNSVSVVGDDSEGVASGGVANVVTVVGEGSAGTATGGIFNTASVVGDGSGAWATGGMFNTVDVVGDGSGAWATDGMFNAASVVGDGSGAWATGGMFNAMNVEGEDSEGVATGGSFNTVDVVGEGSDGMSTGGAFNALSVVGDGSEGVASRGSFNTVDVVGDGSGASATDGTFNTVSVTGNGSDGVASGGAFNTLNVVGDNAEGAVSGGMFKNVTVLADVPHAVDDVYTVYQNGTLTVDGAAGLLANDTDPDGSALTVNAVSEPASGGVSIDTDGSFQYEPDDGFVGTDTFTYTVTNGLNSSTATVTINVVADVPVTLDDTYTAYEGSTLSVDVAGGVLANDSDPGGLALSVDADAPPGHGDLKLYFDGSFDYVPDAGFVGIDSFVYEATNGLHTSTATVTISVVAADPDTVDDSYTVLENGVLQIDAATGVLANDSDPGGLAIFVDEITQPANGQVTMDTDGAFDYQPDADFIGTDTFTYTASNGTYTSTATVTLNVVADVPETIDDSYTVVENGVLETDAATGVLANDSDPGGLAIFVDEITQPANGHVTMDTDGAFDYQPDADFIGTDTFTYTASNGTYSSTATVTVTVTATAAVVTDISVTERDT